MQNNYYYILIYWKVVPKPVLSVINTAVPVVRSDLGVDDLENDFLRGTLILTDVSFLLMSTRSHSYSAGLPFQPQSCTHLETCPDKSMTLKGTLYTPWEPVFLCS